MAKLRWQHPESMNHDSMFLWYNYTIINCLLTIFMRNYYPQPIYYTYVSKYCETDKDSWCGTAWMEYFCPTHTWLPCLTQTLEHCTVSSGPTRFLTARAHSVSKTMSTLFKAKLSHTELHSCTSHWRCFITTTVFTATLTTAQKWNKKKLHFVF